jgi:two-component system, NtrC family, response regulator AtoC
MPATILVVDEDHTWSLDRLVGRSPALNELRETVVRLARNPAVPVLFVGEVGTGRSLAAKILHHLSDRRGRAFASVMCASAPASRLDEALMESVDGGTLFLSGVHLASEHLNDALRRWIDRSPATADAPGDGRNVRIVASSDSDIDTARGTAMVAGEWCRRLCAEIVHIPPLRARAADLEPLVRHYIEVFNQELGKHVGGVGADAIEAVESYSWPGNIRELRAVLERAMLVADGELLHARNLALPDVSRRTGTEMDLPPSGVNLERLERNLVIQALQRTGGNQTRAATLLGLNRDQVRYRIEKFGLPRN